MNNNNENNRISGNETDIPRRSTNKTIELSVIYLDY